jgi:hydroxymethylbilane synthase
LRRLRPDFQFALLRGNVEERVAQLENKKFDGTVLAYAGLARLGLLAHAAEVFSLSVLPPDPAQGAIGIICHSDNFVARRALQLINHRPTYAEVTAERALLRSLPKPDALALGAIARVHENRLEISALLVSEDGVQEWSGQVNGLVDDADLIGVRLGRDLRGPAKRLLSA